MSTKQQSRPCSRREVLKRLGAAGAGAIAAPLVSDRPGLGRRRRCAQPAAERGRHRDRRPLPGPDPGGPAAGREPGGPVRRGPGAVGAGREAGGSGEPGRASGAQGQAVRRLSPTAGQGEVARRRAGGHGLPLARAVVRGLHEGRQARVLREAAGPQDRRGPRADRTGAAVQGRHTARHPRRRQPGLPPLGRSDSSRPARPGPPGPHVV